VPKIQQDLTEAGGDERNIFLMKNNSKKEFLVTIKAQAKINFG
jgi:hypothetical protein